MSLKKSEFKITFDYDFRGYGLLKLLNKNGKVLALCKARTGSIDRKGKLINNISDEKQYVITHTSEKPVMSEIDRMWISGENSPKIWAYKFRLYKLKNTIPEFTHILIHADGSYKNKHDKNGTRGCIGLLQNYNDFKLILNSLIRKNEYIPIYITHSKKGEKKMFKLPKLSDLYINPEFKKVTTSKKVLFSGSGVSITILLTKFILSQYPTVGGACQTYFGLSGDVIIPAILGGIGVGLKNMYKHFLKIRE